MPPKKPSKSRLDNVEQPSIKAWEQGLQSATFSEEVYTVVLWIVVLLIFYAILVLLSSVFCVSSVL